VEKELTHGRYSAKNSVSSSSRAIVVLLIAGVFLVRVPTVDAQLNAEAKEQSNIILGNCETNAALLDLVYAVGENNGLTIVIARLGDGEKQSSLNQRRLKVVREYLTEKRWNKPKESLILAEGEPTTGLGRLEFYVSGRLVKTLLIRRRQTFEVFNCAR
jgi:hypothetical protein